jgi:hypothetical protein
MDQAVVVFSRSGMFSTTISAREIHSHEHARKLWPLVTPSVPRQLVTWVKPTFEDGRKKRRSHFRTLTGVKRVGADQVFAQEEAARVRASQESPEHSTAKRMIAEALRLRLERGLAMPWFFKDETSSQFYLSGNLLLGAEGIHLEERVKTSFGCEYQLDVAITSKSISKGPIVLGGVEIEWGHQFDGRKALIGKSQAFPLISVDISGMRLDEITPEWADTALTETTRTSEVGTRKTYVYLHDILYPLYVQIPSEIVSDTRHQFVVFAQIDDLTLLDRWAKRLLELVELPKSAMSATIVNAKSEQSRKMLENAGQVVGHDWQRVNDQQCLLLTVERPTPVDVASHLFHLCMAKLFLSHTDSLVGYKYITAIHNNHVDEDVWRHMKWDAGSKRWDSYRILPKRLAEPRSRIVQVINEIAAG